MNTNYPNPISLSTLATYLYWSYFYKLRRIFITILLIIAKVEKIQNQYILFTKFHDPPFESAKSVTRVINLFQFYKNCDLLLTFRSRVIYTCFSSLQTTKFIGHFRRSLQADHIAKFTGHARVHFHKFSSNTVPGELPQRN